MKKAIKDMEAGQEFNYKGNRFRYVGSQPDNKAYAKCEKLNLDKPVTAVFYRNFVVEVDDDV